MSKILVVDDDQLLTDSLKSALSKEGFVVDMANCVEDAEEMLLNFDYDLVILDWQMPGKDGITLLGDMRKRGGRARVLMLTGKTDIQNKIEGLETGADDYVTKPFSKSELVSRVRALLRRPEALQQSSLTGSGVCLDARSFKVSWHDQELPVTKQEYQMLELLMRNKNQVLSAEAILERAWSSFSEATADTVRVHMSRLRKKFENDKHTCPVQTVYGRGYVFVSED